jgi:hypothetical protein
MITVYGLLSSHLSTESKKGLVESEGARASMSYKRRKLKGSGPVKGKWSDCIQPGIKATLGLAQSSAANKRQLQNT